jgi:hypothetical protein
MGKQTCSAWASDDFADCDLAIGSGGCQAERSVDAATWGLAALGSWAAMNVLLWGLLLALLVRRRFWQLLVVLLAWILQG